MRSHMASSASQRDIAEPALVSRTLVCRLWQGKNDGNMRRQADHGARAQW